MSFIYKTSILIIAVILFKLILMIISNTSSGFWLTQPVFHIHNISYWIKPIGIVNKSPPHITKFVNLVNTKTIKIPSCLKEYNDASYIKRICSFIQNNYMIHELVSYNPSFDDIIAYLECNKHPSFFITYEEPDLHVNGIELERKILGTMTARILILSIKNKSSFDNFSVYYVDNLCVEPCNRKRGITPQLIQTMYYNVSREITSVNVYMFKREMKLNNIIPLTYYNTLCFDTQTMATLYKHTTHDLIEISDTNINLFIDFIVFNKSRFDCIVLPDDSSLLNLIIKKKITIYLYIVNTVVLLSIVYRNTSLAYCDTNAIECISIVSILNDYTDDDLIFRLFCESIVKQGNSGILLIDDVSDSKKVITKLTNSFKLAFKLPTAFYLFNYICYSHDKYKSLLIY